MKEIVYNINNLCEDDIHGWVKRAKIIVVNSKEEIILAQTNDGYYFLGGHVESNESDFDCLVRELKEEAGIDYEPKIGEPFVSIKYLLKDYPENGVNKGYISNYYVVYEDIVFDSNNVSLTESEKEVNFKIVYIHKDKILDEVDSSLMFCKNKNVVKDTLDVLKFFLENKNSK